MPLVKGQKIRSKEERRRLSVEVWTAKVRGMSNREIARLKGIPESTVRYFLQEAQRVNKFEFDQLTQERIAQDYWLEGKERIKTMWLLFANNKDNPAVQVRCLEAIGAESERMIKTGQSVGLIRKEPETINVQLAAEVITYGIIESVPDPDTRSRLAAAISKRLAAVGVGKDPDGRPEPAGENGH